MVQHRSYLNVADNSGAKQLMVIQVAGKSHQRYGRIGDMLTCVVKGADPNGQIKDAAIVKAVLVRARKETRREDGSYVKFDDNAAVVINPASGEPIGSRVFGPVARELRARNYNKILSLAPEVW
ncbi:MAG: 50S ribosomal protein L14 [bacterium]|nr:50S ribosomal protein L14 [bacterium]